MRAVINAIFYVLRTGCAWRYLPHEYPPWQTVYGYFHSWRKAGVWEQMNAALRDAVREQEERDAPEVVPESVRTDGHGLVLGPFDRGCRRTRLRRRQAHRRAQTVHSGGCLGALAHRCGHQSQHTGA